MRCLTASLDSTHQMPEVILPATVPYVVTKLKINPDVLRASNNVIRHCFSALFPRTPCTCIKTFAAKATTRVATIAAFCNLSFVSMVGYLSVSFHWVCELLGDRYLPGISRPQHRTLLQWVIRLYLLNCFGKAIVSVCLLTSHLMTTSTARSRS